MGRGMGRTCKAGSRSDTNPVCASCTIWFLVPAHHRTNVVPCVPCPRASRGHVLVRGVIVAMYAHPCPRKAVGIPHKQPRRALRGTCFCGTLETDPLRIAARSPPPGPSGRDSGVSTSCHALFLTPAIPAIPHNPRLIPRAIRVPPESSTQRQPTTSHHDRTSTQPHEQGNIAVRPVNAPNPNRTPAEPRRNPGGTPAEPRRNRKCTEPSGACLDQMSLSSWRWPGTPIFSQIRPLSIPFSAI